MRLLRLTADEIEKLLNKLESEAKTLKEEALHLSWGMRGGVSYNEALMLSVTEREIIAKLIEHNLEITKKTRLPYF